MPTVLSQVEEVKKMTIFDYISAIILGSIGVVWLTAALYIILEG